MKRILLVLALLASLGQAKAQLVISQVYGGAGCGTAGCSTYKNDYIEIFNNSSSPVNLNGYSVQYSAATGTAWQVTALTNVTLQPGQYYLVAESAGANGVNSIPTPDATGTVAMSATAAKVAIVTSITALSGACPTGASILDLVGYGATANCNEGGANAPAPSTTTADVRAGGGCTDAGNNSTDFTATAPNPRNTSTALAPCLVVAPVTMGSFKGVYNREEGTISLSWTTLSESNTDHFEMQRSSDGATWTKLGQVAAAGNSSVEKRYAISDVKPGTGRNLYRLLQVDKDLHSKYSDVVTVTIGKGCASFTLAPNPAKGETWIRSASTIPELLQVTLLDAGGRTVVKQSATVSLSAPLRLDLSRLKGGQYFIQISGVSNTQTEKIIVNQ